MTKPKDDPKPKQVTVALDPKQKGDFKKLGGSQADDWNQRLANLVTSAMPIDHSGGEDCVRASKAVYHAMIDVAPADPIEGMLIAQLMAANDAALALYQRGWRNVTVPEYFEGGTKFLQLADKAARTVALLTERLDHHRGRGQQQITVKHVTTNNVTADQAIIADSVTTGGGARSVASPALLAASPAMPMPILDETRLPNPVGVGGGTKSK
jgi:hypothetical protein